MPRRSRRLGACVAIVLATCLTPTVGRAQGRWVDPYESGVKAVRDMRWADAVTDLTKAIAIDPNAQAQKQYEGVYREDYFPYFYRGIAYLRLKDYAKAQQDLDQASKTRMPDALTQELRQRRADVQQALNPPAPTSTPTPPAAASTPPAAPPVAAPPPGPDPHVQAGDLVKQGNSLLAQGKPAEAETSFQSAQKLWPQAPGLQDGLNAVANRNKYELLRTSALQARQSGRPADAVTAYEQAKAVDPQQYAADHLDQQMQLAQNDLAQHQQQVTLAERTKALAEGANRFNNGVDLARQHKYAEADAKYQAALDADPTNTQAKEALSKSGQYSSNVTKGRSLEKQGDLNGARVSFSDAEALDGERFRSEGLDRELADITRRLTTAAKTETTTTTSGATTSPPIYDALVAYLKGDMPDAIRRLQPIASNDATFSATGRATVHGYLGAAYATSALEAHTAADRDTWRGKAISEFKRAEAAEPGFQLPGKIVSPAIQAIFDAARRQ